MDHNGVHRPLDGDGDGVALPDMGAYEFIRDEDEDGVFDDGDFSGSDSDHPCSCGAASVCDDNFRAVANPLQGDSDCDGVGDACDAEACDGIDNNGNGQIDEGNPEGGTLRTTGLQGVCADGTVTCLSGSLTCQQNAQEANELCDGLDNDCNGVAGDVPGGCSGLAIT